MTSSLQGAGRELDVEIAEKVMGCSVLHTTEANLFGADVLCQCESGAHAYAGFDDEDLLPIPSLARYSKNISAAFLVVEKMTTEAEGWERWSFGLFFDGDSKRWTARFSFMMMGARGEKEYPLYEGEADAETAPLAICLAALASVSLTDKET